MRNVECEFKAQSVLVGFGPCSFDRTDFGNMLAQLGAPIGRIPDFRSAY